MTVSQSFLLSGDCLNVAGTAWLSKLILWATSLHTKLAWCSHTACYIGEGRCIEALNKAKITELKRYDHKSFKLKVYRIPLTPDQRYAFTNGAFDIANRSYGWTKLPLFLLDALTTRLLSFFGRKTPAFFFTKYFGIFSIPVCSQLFVYILHKYCGYYLIDSRGRKVSWRIVQPDYLDDLLRLPVNKAEVVYSQNI